MNKLKLIPGIAILFYFIMGSTFASIMLPKHYPTSFEISGTITKTVKNKRLIELDKAVYYVHPVHDIYTLKKSSKTTLYSLKPGMKIGGKFSIYNGKRVLTEIWILPKDYPTKPHAI